MQLRPYQQEAKEAILEEWDSGVDKTLLVLPTGTGKTIVFASVIAERVRRGGRALVLAHRAELLDQAADKLATATGLQCAVEKAEQTAVDSFFRVTVGSVQTLMRDKRLNAYPRGYYDTIVVDEAHHAISDSYQKVLDYFDSAKVLGVTATPDRGDMQSLGEYFDSVAYEYSIVQAIRENYLCPIKVLNIPLSIDLSGVAVQSGDYQVSGLGTALDPYLEQIADEIVKNCKDRKTVVFLPLIATSQKFCQMLQDRGIKATEVNGDSPDRTEKLEAFDRGDYQVICNAMLLTEGWDCPSVDCIVVLRPTKVRSLYCQMVGRGTRLNQGKNDLLVLDFLWLTERHELCRPACLVARNKDVADRMTEVFEASGYALDLDETEVTASEDVQAQREESLAQELKAMRKRKRQLVDPLQFEMSIAAEDLSGYVPAFGWEMMPASDAQKHAIEKFGLDPDEIENAGKASLLLDRLIKRKNEGYSTPKQIRLLERYGFRHVGDWEFEVASKMISRIAINSWRVPINVSPEAYDPRKEITA
ncbi:MAG: DEAD/DEAH box helicase [Eubacteriales bacterium]|nr:DEAD/DEAH box helicase [Eubacteriales bacterium]